MRELLRVQNNNKFAKFFLICCLFFAVCIALGMVAAHRIGGSAGNAAKNYISGAVLKNSDWFRVVKRAVARDFRYTCFALVCPFTVCTPFLLLALLGFDGFCKGLAVMTAAGTLAPGRASVLCAVVLASCIMNVPLYITMFFLCRKKSKSERAAAFSSAFADYMAYAFGVMIVFALLCLVDVIQAAVCILI